MIRKINILIISLLLVSCATNRKTNVLTSDKDFKEIVFVSVNDMHSHIEMMPKFAYIVDSLRVIYPDLILVSAGDNRTGNVYNDKSPLGPNVPMIELMNELGFSVGELGNHEFDRSINGLEHFVDNTNFPIICANADFSYYPELDGKIKPYVKFKKNDVDVIILGMIETSNDGYPSAHLDSIKNVRFTSAELKINEYLTLRDSCDIFVLLDHCGLDADTAFANSFPEFDLIIGGHSHDAIIRQFENGVVYTQSYKHLEKTTVTKIIVKDGKISKKESQQIDLVKVTKTNAEIQRKIDVYCNVPEFNVIVGRSKQPLSNKTELGAFMADAQRHLTKTDFAMQNPGGVRIGSIASTNICVADILNLDPFNNELVTGQMTGKQIEEFLNIASRSDHGPLHISGGTYTIEHFFDKNDKSNKKDHYINAKVYLENGQRIDPEKVYSFTVNSYMVTQLEKIGVNTEKFGKCTNDAEFKYLEDMEIIDYQGVDRCKSTLIEK